MTATPDPRTKPETAEEARVLSERDRRSLLLFPELCSEAVTRVGELEPCEKPAVAARFDPSEGSAYAVCTRHARAPMASLRDLLNPGAVLAASTAVTGERECDEPGHLPIKWYRDRIEEQVQQRQQERLDRAWEAAQSAATAVTGQDERAALDPLAEARKASMAAYNHAAAEMHREARYQTERRGGFRPGEHEYDMYGHAADRFAEMERTFEFLASVPRDALLAAAPATAVTAAEDETRALVERIEAALAVRGGASCDVSCAGYSVDDDGCFVANLAARVRAALPAPVVAAVPADPNEED